MNTPTICALSAAAAALRAHDTESELLRERLRIRKKERADLAAKVAECIAVVCGNGTPDLFTGPAAADPEPAVTPPLAEGELVELELVRAAVLADIAAVDADPALRAVAAFFSAEHEVLDVGDLWDWLDTDFIDQGGMSRKGLAYAIAYLADQRTSFMHLVKDGERFAGVLFDWLASNGHEPKAVEVRPVTREEEDAALRRMLLNHVQDAPKRWQPLIDCGATDDQIRERLKFEWGTYAGSSGGKGELQIDANGSKPCVWFGGKKDAKQKPDLAGKELVARVREVLGIGYPPAGRLPTPPVSKPVGEGLLRDIPGITHADADELDADDLRTLADLEARVKEKMGGYDRLASLNTQIYKVLNLPLGGFMGPDADRIANAIDAHLKPAPAPTPVSHEPAEAEDLTAEEEQRVGAKPVKSPGDERKLKAMAEWRRRQAAGEATPTWGLWAEFAVYLADGSMVAVLYDPTHGLGTDVFEFHGQAASPTGYRSHYEPLKNGRHPKTPLEKWAKEFCEKLAGETKADKAKDARKRLKQPAKKQATKPTPKKPKAKAAK